MSLSGPVIKNNERLLFFVSGEAKDIEDGFPRPGVDGMLPRNGLRGGNWQAKLNAKLTDVLRLEFGTLGSKETRDLYVHSYKYNIGHSPKREDSNNSYYARLTHALSKKTFYKVAFNHFYTKSYTGDGDYFKDLSRYGRKILGRMMDDE